MNIGIIFAISSIIIGGSLGFIFIKSQNNLNDGQKTCILHSGAQSITIRDGSLIILCKDSVVEVHNTFDFRFVEGVK